MSKFIDDHVAGFIDDHDPAPLRQVELPIIEIAPETVTAEPVRTTLGSVEEPQVLLTRPELSTGRELHWRLGRAVWPTEVLGQAGDDRMEKLLLTVREAADVLSVSRSRVYELIYAEQLDSVKLGRSRRVSLASVRRLADGQSVS